MASPEIQGLRNVVESTMADPNWLRLAVAGVFLEDDPARALDDLARTIGALEPDA